MEIKTSVFLPIGNFYNFHFSTLAKKNGLLPVYLGKKMEYKNTACLHDHSK